MSTPFNSKVCENRMNHKYYPGDSYLRRVNWIELHPRISIYKDPILWGKKSGQGPFTRQPALISLSQEQAKHLVGLLADIGIVTDKQFGKPYKKVQESASERLRSKVFEVDPDIIDRGTRAHARTQNSLANFLISHGISPLSPNEHEPPFDLAWKRGETIFVAEIKSLTKSNEDKQLRMALGQILHYRHLLLPKWPKVRAVIATERRPSNDCWPALCASHKVILVWPGAYDEALITNAKKG